MADTKPHKVKQDMANQDGGKPDKDERSLLYRLGCKVSAWVSDAAAHPFAQLAVIVVCVGWFALGFTSDLLTAALSIIAITLTQMVLNRQNEREADAHRRDVAMHAKLDELLVASKRARSEVAGIEDESEDKIEELKREIASRGRRSPDAAPGRGQELRRAAR